MAKKEKNNLLQTQNTGDEFQPEVFGEFDINKLKGVSRRKFLALLGASTAFATTACTNYRDKGEIIPYTRKPEEILIGKADYYSSTCNACSLACGIMVKTREGRPIKILGNPDHPINKGKICAIGEANILNLYDPERLTAPLKRMGNGMINTSWSQTDSDIIKALDNAGTNNKEIALITHTINSPALSKLLEEFKTKYPATNIYSYEFFNEDVRKKAWNKSYGNSPLPVIDWNKAKVIFALDADFIGNEGHFIEQMRKFSEQRNVEDLENFSRLYIVEAGLSLTGANADVRFRLRPELQFDFVMSLINEILKKTNSAISLDSTITGKFNNYSLDSFAKANSLSINNLKNLVSDLIKNKCKSIVYAGFKLDEQTHIAVNLLNEILGNTEIYNSNANSVEILPLSDKSEIQSLIQKMNDGKIGVVLHFDTNPVFHFPKDYGYESALKKVENVFTLTESQNETSSLSKYILPINHCLESWGDYQTRTGIHSLQQPVIAPLYNTRQKEAILLNWLNGQPANYSEDIYHKYLMNYWEKEFYPKAKSLLDFKTFWYSCLHDGVLKIDEETNKSGKFNNESLKEIFQNRLPDANGYTLILQKNYFIGDGRFANNGWLQEIPHPITKITWDNYAVISTQTAKELKLEIENKIEIKANGTTLVLPVMVQPGVADKTIIIELGYGRTVIGDVGKDVGVNANLFQSKDAKLSGCWINNVTITKVNGIYKLAATQEHHKLDEAFVKDLQFRRNIIRESTVAIYKKDSKPLHKKEEHLTNINKEIKYTGVKWAMAIDLNKCTGCSRCVASCNVENNIPVVGKEQVLNGREMQWLRIDRYYTGTDNEPSVNVQPMFCVQCDNAPCENVCPVAATNHSPDGLNQMVYNRCVGTRYCSNNCPYKVRRFNYFDYRDHFANGYYYKDSLQLLHNPEVTVRPRGVMEKCTFCIQRIMEARQVAIQEGRPLKGSDVKTACQVSCPTNAIVFGDMNDPDSDISKLIKHNLNYVVLEELNIKPNLSYIAKLRNLPSEDI